MLQRHVLGLFQQLLFCWITFIAAGSGHPTAIFAGLVHRAAGGGLRADAGGVVEGEELAAGRRVLAAGLALADVLHDEHVDHRSLALARLGTIRTS